MQNYQSSADITKLNLETIDWLHKLRLKQLEAISQWVSLKSKHKIIEKIEIEKQELLNLLDIKTQDKDALSHYSFPLDPQFFQQLFLPNTPK